MKRKRVGRMRCMRCLHSRRAEVLQMWDAVRGGSDAWAKYRYVPKTYYDIKVMGSKSGKGVECMCMECGYRYISRSEAAKVRWRNKQEKQYGTGTMV